ncbi:MAG: hypothetical protein JNM30_07685 [Rhodospirillales bacterium]|nr:hypothetical protein [Rhodospirillales bacterium]
MLEPQIRDEHRKCIFCRELYHFRALTEEHIIPRSLGGKSTIKYATCESCRRAIDSCENNCEKHWFGLVRPHMKIPGRKQLRSRSKTHGAIYLPTSRGPRQRNIPLEDHPALLMQAKFTGPGMMKGKPASIEPEGATMSLWSLVRDYGRRLESFPGETVINRAHAAFYGRGQKLRCSDYARLIAKIAHCYAIANSPADSFSTCLNNFILGREAVFTPNYYIGSYNNGPIIQSRNPKKHGLVFCDTVIGGTKFHFVVVRLFAAFNGIAHQIVVGTSKP